MHFWESKNVRCNNFFACMRQKMNFFFDILLFSEKRQNLDKTHNLCIFGNLGLSGVGKFCMRATKN